MNMYDYQVIRRSFGLNQAEAGKLINLSGLAVSRIEEALVNAPENYRALWVELSEYKQEYISKSVSHMPRRQFKGTDKQWAARESAVGHCLSVHLASKASESFNPAFSQLNQPMLTN